MVRAGLASDPTDPMGHTVADRTTDRTVGRTAGLTRTTWEEALGWAEALRGQWATTEAAPVGPAGRVGQGGTTWGGRAGRVVEARQERTCMGTVGLDSDRTDLIPTVLVVRTALTRMGWEDRSEAEARLTL